MDMALFKGKSAKIGWSKGSAFYKPLWDFDNASYFALMDEFSTPNKLQVVATETSSFFEVIFISVRTIYYFDMFAVHNGFSGALPRTV